MIVIIGSPVLGDSPASTGRDVAGLAGRVALAAAAASRTVQLVGKVGDDDAGDALLVALARGGVGHAALLRDAAHATPVDLSAASEDGPGEGSVLDDRDDDDDAAPVRSPQSVPGLPLDPADIELALRYLTDFQVVVIAAPLDAASLRATLEAASFSGAHVIRLQARGAELLETGTTGVEVTAFETPDRDEPAFSTMVGRYAAGLDAGRIPSEAFADATRGANWERAAPD